MPTEKGSIRLTVAEAYSRDVGRKVARVSISAMEAIGASTGDVIEVKGKKSTAAIAWPLSGETRTDIIRMDGFLRRSAGASLGDSVEVRKAESRRAARVTLSPSGVRISGIDESFKEYVKAKLLDKPVVAGDLIPVPVFGGETLDLVVTETRPSGIVVVTDATRIEVTEAPREVRPGVPRVTYEDIGDLEEAKRFLNSKNLDKIEKALI